MNRSQSDRFLKSSRVYSFDRSRSPSKQPASPNLIVDRDIELFVDLSRASVKIRGAQDRKYPVNYHGLRVNHGRLKLVDFHASFEQCAISSASGCLRCRLVVVFAREQQAHIDATLNRGYQGARLAGTRGAIGIGNVNGLPCAGERHRLDQG